MIITNLGTINTTVDLSAQTTVTGYVNGSSTVRTATISGTSFGLYDRSVTPLTSVINYGTITTSSPYYSTLSIAAPITLSNYGSITAANNYANAAASVADGSTVNNYLGAVISGYNGLVLADGTSPDNVTNQGRIVGSGGTGLSIGSGGLVEGTVINNGTAVGSTALISGSGGVASSSPVILNNFGSITATAGFGVNITTPAAVPSWVFNDGAISATNDGVFVVNGAVVNGAPNITTATITGSTGVAGQQPTSQLQNYGHVLGTSGYGVEMPGNIINGGTADTTASIISNTTDGIVGLTGNATNYGLIKGAADGVNGGNSAVITNYGTIEGGSGNSAIQLSGTGATINNYGTIKSDAGATGLAIIDQLGITSITNAAGASIIGNIVGKVGTITNNGTITLNGGAGFGGLDVTGAIDPSSSGVFQLATPASVGGSGSLEIAAALGTNLKIQFIGPAAHRNMLTIDNTAQFGKNIGSSSYAGPLLEGFSAGDAIDLKTLPFAGLGWTPVLVNPTTEDLQFTSGGKNVATLQFQVSSLGTGTFHVQADQYGNTYVTHS